MIKRYVPSMIDAPDWNIKTASKEERVKIKSRLVLRQVSEEEYKHVIAYMYMKFPHEMDLTKLPDGTPNVPIQWRYTAGSNKRPTWNKELNRTQDMYAFIVYDEGRDREPVAFAGSYFTIGKAHSFDEDNIPFLVDEKGNKNVNGKYQYYGNGIVMFVDPDYRRMGLATDLWWAEAELYKSLNIRYQKEIQNEYSLKSTQNMFSDPSKCIITSEGRLKSDGTRCQIRCLLDYTDKELSENFNKMLPGLQSINNIFAYHNYIIRAYMDGINVDILEKVFERGKLVY